MKTIIDAVKYRTLLFLKESKAATPFIVIIIYQYVMYTIKPLGIVDSFCMAGYLVFFTMTWMGFSIENGEDAVLEQIQLLRMQNTITYCLGKTLQMMLIGLGTSFLCILLPIISNLMNHSELFFRQLTAFDILNAIILLSGCAFLGGELGSFFNPHTIKDKKLTVVMCCMAVLLIVIKVPLYQEVPFFKWISWLIPSLSQMSVDYAGTDIFSLPLTLMLFLSMAIYGMILAALRTFLFMKRKF